MQIECAKGMFKEDFVNGMQESQSERDGKKKEPNEKEIASFS